METMHEDTTRLKLMNESLQTTNRTIIPTAGLSELDTDNITDFGEYKASVTETNSFAPRHSTDSKLRKPAIIRGIIEDWDTLTRLWDNLVHDIGASDFGAACPVLLTDTMFERCASRERMAEAMFEESHVPGMAVGNTSVLSLFASGRTCGLVVEAGAGTSTCVPVFEGFPLAHAVQRLDVAGADLTKLLVSSIGADPRNSGACLRAETADHIKESWCRILPSAPAGTTADANMILSQHTDKGGDGDLVRQSYELPDGTTISILDSALSLVPEALFRPQMIDAQSNQSSSAKDSQVRISLGISSYSTKVTFFAR
jgi:actin-related protein